MSSWKVRRGGVGAALSVVVLATAGCSLPAPTRQAAPSSASAPTAAAGRTRAAVAAQPLAGRTIMLDPGHNGGNGAQPRQISRLVDAGFGRRKACNTTGTQTAAGYAEHAQVWDVAQRVAPLLRARGARVVLTRGSDTGVGPCVDTRGRAGQSAGADLMVSIHADGVLDQAARGFHVISAPTMAGGVEVQQRSRVLAEAIRDAMRARTPMPVASYLGGGTGVSSRTDLAGLNLATVPTAVLEGGNMRNPEDAALLSSPTFRQQQAQALTDAIQKYLRSG